ncbi:HK97 family phage prohead protease [Mycobacterium malmoense]|uniref:HK97 family phage prohead protease n=1 Tax=Mycobacterium malmoense TaxID=1780 RepID=UPI0009F4C0B7|nr:HK97 family phage prohead protease [Mycobacterium malmoense]
MKATDSGHPVESLPTVPFSRDLRVETRSLDGHWSRVIGGYAAVFGKRSHPMGGIRELVEPSFFNKSQADGWPMVVCRHEHDPRMLLGSTAGGTLQLSIDKNGLDYSVQVPESRSDVWELAGRGDLPGSSFSFQAYQDDWRLGDGGIPERHLVSGRLVDVASTATPAYPDATVKTAYRSLAAHMEAEYEEVVQFAARNELRSLFMRTDRHVVAPPAVLPGEVRSDPAAAVGELELRRRRNELRAMEVGYDPADPGQRLLSWYRRKNLMNTPAPEERSQWFPRVS